MPGRREDGEGYGFLFEYYGKGSFKAFSARACPFTRAQLLVTGFQPDHHSAAVIVVAPDGTFYSSLEVNPPFVYRCLSAAAISFNDSGGEYVNNSGNVDTTGDVDIGGASGGTSVREGAESQPVCMRATLLDNGLVVG